MARIRTIKPEFVESESIGKLGRNARLLFIQLWTFVDDEGRARASSRLLASRLYPYDEDAPKLIGHWLEELERGGHVRLYEIEGDQYLDIPKWLKHQKIDHPSKSRLPEFPEGFAKPRETFAPHTLDLGPRTLDLVPKDSPPDASHQVPPKGKQANGTRLPENWRPNDAGRSFATDRGMDPDSTAEAFADYWTANNGRTAIKRDWNAAFRTWCRRANADGVLAKATNRPVPPTEAVARIMTSSLLSQIVHETLVDVRGRDGQFDYTKPGLFRILPGCPIADLNHCLEQVDKSCERAPEDAVAQHVAILKARTASPNKDAAEARFEAEVMIADLSRYPLDVVEYACEYWIDGGVGSKWFPSWPELKEICERRVEGRKRLQRALIHALNEAHEANKKNEGPDDF